MRVIWKMVRRWWKACAEERERARRMQVDADYLADVDNEDAGPSMLG